MESEFGSFSKKVTVVSFLMQLGIVMVHMDTDHFFELGTSETFSDYLCQWISKLCFDGGTVSLSFFMICSAFLLYYNLSKENMLEKFRRRISSLLIPFLIWNGIGMIFCAVYWWNTEGFDIIFSYIPFQFVMSRYCAVMWFSEALLFFLLFIPVILWVMRKKVIGELVLFGFFVCGYLEWGFLEKNILHQYIDFEIYRFLSYVPMYLLGAYLGVRFSEGIISEKYNRWQVKLAAVLLWAASYALPGSFSAYCLTMLRPLYAWVIIDKSWLTFRLRWWMENNFFIYAVHYFLILAIVPMLCRIYSCVITTNVFVTVWRLVCFLIITLLSEMMGWLLIRFAPKAYRLCTGGRTPKL